MRRRSLWRYLALATVVSAFFTGAAGAMFLARILVWMAFGDWSLSEAGSAILVVLGAAGGIAAAGYVANDIRRGG